MPFAATTGCRSRVPRARAVDFFEVDLTIEVPGDWLAAGPGRRRAEESSAGRARFRFAPPAVVPDVALIASRFESRSIDQAA